KGKRWFRHIFQQQIPEALRRAGTAAKSRFSPTHCSGTTRATAGVGQTRDILMLLLLFRAKNRREAKGAARTSLRAAPFERSLLFRDIYTHVACAVAWVGFQSLHVVTVGDRHGEVHRKDSYRFIPDYLRCFLVEFLAFILV